MEESDAKKMLDLCIYDYLNKNNLHAIAENFARESEIFPKTVAIDNESLSDYWSLFSDIYSKSGSPSSQQTQNGGPENVHPVPQEPESDMNNMPENVYASSLQRPGLPPRPDVGNLFQNDFPSRMPRHEQMSANVLAARMCQLAVTRDDNTGTGLKISTSGEQYEMESKYIGSSTSSDSTGSVLRSSTNFNRASAYTDSGTEEQSDR